MTTYPLLAAVRDDVLLLPAADSDGDPLHKDLHHGQEDHTQGIHHQPLSYCAQRGLGRDD
jgi:hypothetical protein